MSSNPAWPRFLFDSPELKQWETNLVEERKRLVDLVGESGNIPALTTLPSRNPESIHNGNTWTEGLSNYNAAFLFQNDLEIAKLKLHHRVMSLSRVQARSLVLEWLQRMESFALRPTPEQLETRDVDKKYAAFLNTLQTSRTELERTTADDGPFRVRLEWDLLRARDNLLRDVRLLAKAIFNFEKEKVDRVALKPRAEKLFKELEELDDQVKQLKAEVPKIDKQVVDAGLGKKLFAKLKKRILNSISAMDGDVKDMEELREDYNQGNYTGTASGMLDDMDLYLADGLLSLSALVDLKISYLKAVDEAIEARKEMHSALATHFSEKQRLPSKYPLEEMSEEPLPLENLVMDYSGMYEDEKVSSSSSSSSMITEFELKGLNSVSSPTAREMELERRLKELKEERESREAKIPDEGTVNGTISRLVDSSREDEKSRLQSMLRRIPDEAYREKIENAVYPKAAVESYKDWLNLSRKRVEDIKNLEDETAAELEARKKLRSVEDIYNEFNAFIKRWLDDDGEFIIPQPSEGSPFLSRYKAVEKQMQNAQSAFIAAGVQLKKAKRLLDEEDYQKKEKAINDAIRNGGLILQSGRADASALVPHLNSLALALGRAPRNKRHPLSLSDDEEAPLQKRQRVAGATDFTLRHRLLPEVLGDKKHLHRLSSKELLKAEKRWIREMPHHTQRVFYMREDSNISPGKWNQMLRTALDKDKASKEMRSFVETVQELMEEEERRKRGVGIGFDIEDEDEDEENQRGYDPLVSLEDNIGLVEALQYDFERAHKIKLPEVTLYVRLSSWWADLAKRDPSRRDVFIKRGEEAQAKAFEILNEEAEDIKNGWEEID